MYGFTASTANLGKLQRLNKKKKEPASPRDKLHVDFFKQLSLITNQLAK